MKIPLFFYDYEARQYKLFPYPQMFTELSDGTIGFRFEANLDNYAKKATFQKYRYLFEPNPIKSRPTPPLNDYEYRLKRQS